MKRRQAFTLIELLVVIGIIAILATLSVANYSTAVRRGRDARRKLDISNISQALVLYRAEKGTYPNTNIDGLNHASAGTSLKANKYMSEVSTHSTLGATYKYTYTPGCSGGTCSTFVLCTDKLEAGDGNASNEVGANFNSCGTSCDYFCAKNP